jgi:hypothetical protein
MILAPAASAKAAEVADIAGVALTAAVIMLGEKPSEKVKVVGTTVVQAWIARMVLVQTMIIERPGKRGLLQGTPPLSKVALRRIPVEESSSCATGGPEAQMQHQLET